MKSPGIDVLAKRARGLELLLHLGVELHAERVLQSLLEKIWVELTRVLEAERSSLFLVDEETQELYSVIAQKADQIRFPMGKGIAGAVAATGVSLLIPDAYEDPRFNPEIDRRTGFRTRSILTVALKNQSGEVLGVAQVLNRMDGKPFDDEDRLLLEALASLAAMAIETVQLYEEESRATEAVISGLMIAVEMRDPKLILHSQEVRAYARGMAAAMNLPEEEIRRIERAAALHDIGKIAVPDRVLTKDKPLTADERVAYEDHALYAKEFLETMKFSGELAGLEHIAPYHHKRFAGGGFPAGPPEGAEIPLGARIIAVADELAVLMRSRWGRRAMSQGDAIRSIRQRAGTDFDPEPVAALFQLEPQLEEIRHRVFSGVVGHLGHETQ